MATKRERQQWAAKILGGKVSVGLGATHGASLRWDRKALEGKVLGIDPSLRGTGLAVVEFSGGRGRWCASRTLKLGPKLSMVECLGRIAGEVRALVAAWQPQVVAVEETIYVQNFRTAQILGAARGAAIGAVAADGLAVFEYSPLRIKQAVTGFGRASKEQVARQVQALLGMEGALSYDEADAAAVAICHALTEGRMPIGGKVDGTV